MKPKKPQFHLYLLFLLIFLGHTCRRCVWSFLKANLSSKCWSVHNRVYGTLEGFTKIIIDSEAGFDDEHRSDSNYQHHSDSDSNDQEEKEKTPND